jgi:TRAF3-interacting protein 1
MSLEELVAITKDVISAIISKPKMAEKLLSKPPFRFLHDVFSGITTTTGFAEGLMQGDELNSASITDKSAKIAYLEKLFNFLGVCTGKSYEVRAAKVVAGLEPENTNIFLTAFAEAASDSSYDTNAAVERCLNGEQAGTGPPALKGSSGGGSGSPDRAESKGGDMEDGGAKMASPLSGFGDAKDEDRGKSRGGTRGGRPARESTDVGLGGMAGPTTINLDGEVEKCDGAISLTQELLGPLITKPKLSEKLLGKPPFRFLFDIIMEVIKATGFGEGLYTVDECDSSTISDKNAKMQFLEKIIRLVGVQLNTIVEARPAKIVAGLDAHLTNIFLQLLAVCGKHNPDSSSAIPTVLDQMGVEGGEIPAPKGGRNSQPQESKSSSSSSEPKHEERQEIAPAKTIEGERREIVGSSSAKSAAGEEGDDGETKRTGRPTTARRRPPKVKEGAKEVDKQATPVKKAEGIMTDGGDDDDDEVPDEIDERLADDVNADSKTGGSSSSADPESKLVRDILGRQAEQEAERNPNASLRSGQQDNAADKQEQQGGGIRLGRLRKTGMEKKSSSNGNNNDLQQLGEGDIERLRVSIQSLVQHTGPLGGCLDYLQEDVGLMNVELRKWEDECRKYEVRVETERSKSAEVLHPLQSELAEIEAQIAERAALISSTKSNISRNEERLMQLLKLVSSS